MKRILVVAGTRPEAIKLAPVVFALRQCPGIDVVLCSSGQHRELLQQALTVFGLKPDIDLGVMRPNQALASLTAGLMRAFDAALVERCPDWVIIQGDTTTAFCAALAAFYRSIPVAHVEAGLRTHDLTAPFPEEANRQLIARIATLHFGPTQRARENLIDEGVPENRITVTGNTVVDAVHWIQEKWQQHGSPPLPNELARLGEGHILVTCHRREHFGEGLQAICAALKLIAARHPERTLVFPVHLNPNVRGVVRAQLNGVANVRLVEPIDYEASLLMLSQSALVLTDSGGIQEEAPSFHVPAVVMRTRTERIEGVAAGFAVVAGLQTEVIVQQTEALLSDSTLRERLHSRPNPYGDGQAARRIALALTGGDAR